MATTDSPSRLRSASGTTASPAAAALAAQDAASDDDAATDLTVAREAATHVASARLDRFTPDETTVDIIAALARGKSRHAAAELLRISESTVRRKLAQARMGWDVGTNTEVVVTAVRAGLI